MSKRLPTKIGEWINRTKTIQFTFEGKSYTGYQGDTITSALWASGEQVLGRSFKYHRPRGILSLANHDVNIMVTDGLDTNIRADVTPISDGMQLQTVNTGGDVKGDKRRWLDWISPILPVGFYYKAFYKPRRFFPFWEKIIRKSAGLGEVNFGFPRTTKRKLNQHCDILVVGAGPSGLSAALEAANAGFKVTIVDENQQAGGSLGYDMAADLTCQTQLHGLLTKVSAHVNITLITSAYAAGYYTDHLIPIVHAQGIIKMRAKAFIVASGVFEQAPVFRNNDLPGVMLGTAVQRLLYRFSTKPFENGIIFTANAHGYRVAMDLLAFGMAVHTLVDLRQAPEEPLIDTLRKRGVQIYTGHCVYEAIPTSGKMGVQAAKICPYSEISQTPDTSKSFTVSCNGIAISAGWAPAAALLYQAGTRMGYDYNIHQFTPQQLPKGVFAAGKVNGIFGLEQRIADGQRAANEAMSYLGRALKSTNVSDHSGIAPSHEYPIVPHPKAKNFIDFDEDIQLKDFINAAQEGFDNIELMKRFTTVGMGPSQGKHSNMNAIRILAKVRNLPVEKIGSTTARPFFHPIPIGHLAGRSFHPHRLTALHHWHETAHAEFVQAGAWLRPAYYQQKGLSKQECITQEILAVRQSAGLIDASTLGKIEVHGKDAAVFLERFYTGSFASMQIGKVRYALALDESGVIIDDGLAGRLAEDLYYVTASTTNAAVVYREMQHWQQLWQLDIGLVNVTSAYATLNLAGPVAREILAKLSNADLSEAAFSFGTICEMQIANTTARVLRVAFVSDSAYEIHVPSTQASTVWEALLETGAPHQIRPFGTEAQRLLRLEMGHIITGHDTDGLTNPYEAGTEFAIKISKPFFVGQRSLQILQKKTLTKKIVPFILDAHAVETPMECSLVIENGEIAGRITSIGYSPTLKRNIGLAYIKPEMANAGSVFYIRTDKGALVKAAVSSTPFLLLNTEHK